jgi:hypothetical protein
MSYFVEAESEVVAVSKRRKRRRGGGKRVGKSEVTGG